MAYDLRIDAYLDFRVTPQAHYNSLAPGSLIKITRKAKKDDVSEHSEALIDYQIDLVNEKNLNPIEAAHWQKFMLTHQQKVENAEQKNPKKLQLCIGTIEKVSEYDSAIYEKSFELSVRAQDLSGAPIVLLTQDSQYRAGDDVCFLVKREADHFAILGLKPRALVSRYKDAGFFKQKNNEINLIEMP